MVFSKTFGLTIIWVLFHCAAKAKLIIPPIFADNMVLQRNHVIPIWGKSNPGVTIYIRFHNKQYQTITKSDSSWFISIDPLKEGGPYDMFISNSPGEKFKIDNILIGEVWICAGQSNMNFILSSDRTGHQELAGLNLPNIRSFRCPMPQGALNPENKENSKWIMAVGEKAGLFSAVVYFFAKKIEQSLHIPVGIIVMSCGATRSESWTNPMILNSEENLSASRLFWDAQKTIKNLPLNSLPGKFYNDVILPEVPYAAKGVIWYQGESNTLPDNSGHPITERAAEYKPLLKALIKSWRFAWKNENWPIYVVQLPNFKEPSGDIHWAEIRNAQLEVTQETKNTALIVTIDIGDSTNIHPNNKKTVGERIALQALRNEYNYKISGDVKGPSVKSCSLQNSQVLVKFFNVTGGLKGIAGEQLPGFEIAGSSDSGKFVKATAVIVHNSILISSPLIQSPTAVRYGWADNPTISLFNGTGLPASPFKIYLK